MRQQKNIVLRVRLGRREIQEFQVYLGWKVDVEDQEGQVQKEPVVILDLLVHQGQEEQKEKTEYQVL